MSNEYPYHVEVHTSKDGCHLENECDDYRTLDAAIDAAKEMSAEFAHSEYYCEITDTTTGDVVESRNCKDWAR